MRSYLCPRCGATDRDRLQLLFLQERLSQTRELPTSKLRILEIAPSAPVANWLRGRPEVAYRSADLFMSSADDRVDITDMRIYADGAFDLVIGSHVLEHIPDDRRALREIRRILAPEGVAVLLVPISKRIDGVDEDPELTDEAERWRRFGQGDHIRIYGRQGFLARLQEVELRVEEFHPDPEQARTAGLETSNCLYLARAA